VTAGGERGPYTGATMSDVVSANEAARRFGLSEKTVRRWIIAGKLKADKRGRAYRVSLSDVAAINGQAKPDTSGPSADSGHIADIHSAPSTADSLSAMSGIPELVSLVERLHGEVRQYAETAATWQARAEVLAHQLTDAREMIRALEAPKETLAPEPVPSPEPPAVAGWSDRWQGRVPVALVVLAVLAMIGMALPAWAR